MRRRIPPDPHAYHAVNGTWPTPASKHEPLRFGPPYARPKFPTVIWREDWPVMVLVVAMLALSALLRLVTGDGLR
jgi:hypothetical protein